MVADELSNVPPEVVDALSGVAALILALAAAWAWRWLCAAEREAGESGLQGIGDGLVRWKFTEVTKQECFVRR